jgi:hypothetical protein
MSFLIKFVLAMLRGLGGPDLQKWLDDLPKSLGEEIGKIIRAHVGGDGKITDSGFQELSDWLKINLDKVPELFSSLLRGQPDMGHRGSSIIESYLLVLNAVTAAATEIGRPLVLKGFLHTPQCLSYWHRDGGGSFSVRPFTKHPELDVISCHGTTLAIHIMETDSSFERVRDLNRAIRKSDFHRLDHDIYSGAKEVDSIREFEVTWGMTGYEKSVIPNGAPGIIDMLSSLPVAFEAQGEPERALAATLAKAGFRSAQP